jgi:hypothetical protein
MAKVGSIILGFGGSEYNERLLYIAEVTEKPPLGDYYRARCYAKRPDCIYVLNPDGSARRKPSARYHTKTDERRRDVGLKGEKAHVLLSSEFRYFGENGTNDYKQHYSAIKSVVESLKRGHRVNHLKTLRLQLLQLKEAMWQKFSKKKMGQPSVKDLGGICNRSSASTRC